ncbi:LysE family translocator [Shewanella surugensis]|uniref:LysE family transporter n=1 Tax=Shewanella surugensis TaxID=212020 RepID=A0ABT0LG93_9GAMM|nr:LysE family transporter [Shewanella surugensis]MCL1126594.1 LysE family transporter [Shewanella surugensis]
MLDIYASEFIALAIIHILAVIIPGPDFTITVRQSIVYGRTTGLMTSLGIGAGISVHVVYTVLGVGLIIAQSDIAFSIAKIIGAIYLSYLGVNLLRSKKNVENLKFDSTKNMPVNNKKAFLIGFMTNALNPKATLFFLAIFTTVVSQNTPLAIQSLYGVWMCVVNALWFMLVSLLFSYQRVRELFLNLGHWFERIMGTLLLGFAVKLIFTIN